MNSKPLLTALAVVLCAGLLVTQRTTGTAQAGQPPALPTGLLAFGICDTTNYTDVAAKALGVTTLELRKAFASGKTVQDVAASKNVQPSTIENAINDARKAAIAQALKDGVLTQQEVDLLNAFGGGFPPVGAPGGSASTPPAAPNGVIAPSALANGLQSGSAPFGGSQLGTVNLFTTAANSLNMKCAELVKSLLATPGRSIATVAAEKKVDVKAVTDSLVKAVNDSLAQDLKDSVLTQQQVDAQSANLTKAVTDFISNTDFLGGIPGGQGPAGLPPTPKR